MVYWIGTADERSVRAAEFMHALTRPVRERVERGWVHTYKPMIDDAPYRVFEAMSEYKAWCEQLPPWLGYGRG